MKNWIFLFGMLCILLGTSPVHAYSCVVTPTSIITNPYSPFPNNPSDTALQFSMTCTRSGGDPGFPDPSSGQTFLVGVTSSLSLINGADSLTYSLLQVGCATPWSAASRIIVANPQSKGTGSSTKSVGPYSFSACLRIGANQWSAKPPNYSGTIAVIVSDSLGTAWGSSTVSLSTVVNAECHFPVLPNPLQIAYVSFGAQQSGVSDFHLRCTNTSSYSLSLDSYGGTGAAGLAYTLALTPSASGSPLGGTGSGIEQSYIITGTAAAGQSGTCTTGATCLQTTTHTLYITY